MKAETTTKAPQLANSLASMSEEELFFVRAALEIEMRKRKLAFSVGEFGERLAIEYFQRTPGLPKLQPAPKGTKNVDALSRNGDRYSIKTICNAKKTGTVYPDTQDKHKPLFEYLLIVKMNEDWSLNSIYQFPWAKFAELRSWDKRMNAWYIGCSEKTLRAASIIHSASRRNQSSDSVPPARNRHAVPENTGQAQAPNSDLGEALTGL